MSKGANLDRPATIRAHHVSDGRLSAGRRDRSQQALSLDSREGGFEQATFQSRPGRNTRLRYFPKRTSTHRARFLILAIACSRTECPTRPITFQKNRSKAHIQPVSLLVLEMRLESAVAKRQREKHFDVTRPPSGKSRRAVIIAVIIPRTETINMWS